MPFGPEPLGLLYFTGVKLAGYSAAGAYVRKRLSADRPPAIAFGITRTVLGLAVGIGFASTLGALAITNTELLFYLALIPIRMAEWLLTIWLFFGRHTPIPPRTLFKFCALGSGWSFLLDIPAVMSMFILPGGAWIC